MIMVPATAPAAATGAATFLRRLVHLFCFRSRISIYSSLLFRKQSYAKSPPHPTMVRNNNSLRYLERSITEHAAFLPDVTFSNIAGLLEISDASCAAPRTPKVSATVPIVVSIAAVCCSRTTFPRIRPRVFERFRPTTRRPTPDQCSRILPLRGFLNLSSLRPYLFSQRRSKLGLWRILGLCFWLFLFFPFPQASEGTTKHRPPQPPPQRGKKEKVGGCV